MAKFSKMFKVGVVAAVVVFLLLFSGCKKVETQVDLDLSPVQFALNAFSVPSNSLRTSKSLNVEYSKGLGLLTYAELAQVSPTEVSDVRITIDDKEITTFTVPFHLDLVNGTGTTPQIMLIKGNHELTEIGRASCRERV